MKAYKVVRVKHGKRWSAIIDHQSAVALYARSKVTKRRKDNGPLACFRTLQDAVLFTNSLWPYGGDVVEIWEAKIKESKECALWFWSNGILEQTCLLDCPFGTVFADSIKLIKRVRVLRSKPNHHDKP
jgi:hypothetical protein